jgi:ubiquinone/menaquinone biosynthesis C-methylase UbiE
VTGPGEARITADVTAAFDQAADRYDTAGPQFAGPVAGRLVELAALRPGWRVLDAGCGAGAVLTRAAWAVGRGGHVTGMDLAPGMAARAWREALEQGLDGIVTVLQGDAASPRLAAGSLDAVLASLVLYLLPDPAAALVRWRELLKPGGTLAISRGTAPDPRWSPVIAAVDAYASGAPGFETRVRRPGPLWQTTALLGSCGFTAITAVTETVTVRYASPQQWWDASVAEGPWVTWQHIPPSRLPEARTKALAMAASLAEPDGTLQRHIQMGYLTACRPGRLPRRTGEST